MKTTISPDIALQKLITDHRRVQDLFALFEAEDEPSVRHDIGLRAAKALSVHALLEEKVFYPAAEASTGEHALVDDYREEHSVMKAIISELSDLPPGRRFDAKFRSLISVVRGHIEKEETVLFPKVSETGIDLKKLGRRLASFSPDGGGAGSLGLLLAATAAAAGLYYLAQRPSSHSRP